MERLKKMANLELIINITIICLLVPVIIFSYNLNKNLQTLRQKQDSLSALVSALNDATFKAENSIPKLKSVTEHSSEGLKEVVESAKELKDDLLFINERADSLADRLENVISVSRGVNSSSEKTSNSESANLSPKDDRALAEMELLKALRSIK
jgi:uncharacterized phage infection (PIP) family protein YhgE